MMYRVQIRPQLSNLKFFYDGPVSSLDDCHRILAKMEDEWRMWQEQGFPQLSPDRAIQHLEGSEIYVVSDDGTTYWLNGDSGFEIMN